jgi:spore maturation protein CgeB
MRIFLTYHPSGNLSAPGSRTWDHNFYEPLLDLGHDVVLLKMDEIANKHRVKFRSKKFKEIFSREIKEKFTKEQNIKQFDLFFSYVTDYDLDCQVIEYIKKFGVPTVNFSCNNTHQFYLVESISPFFDFSVYSEKDAETKFEKIGANSIWFPMAANPKYYSPQSLPYIYDVSFIGSAYAKRPYYINHLLSNNINVDCFGPNWLINKPRNNYKLIKKETDRFRNLIDSIVTVNSEKRLRLSQKILNYDLLKNLRSKSRGRLHYPLPDNEIIKTIASSKINLGFLEVFSGSKDPVLQQHLHLREFEIPMCGGLYFTNYSEELSEFFVQDQEVIMFYNEHDLLDKISYYISHEDLAAKVRRAGHARAIKDHTYHRRFQTLFSQIFK